ncbi:MULTISPECIES: hypothetical protein [Serratia]|uniref:hypothetical protein n=1 Tax=Serratia TaxID=613 RepID=UPI0015741942|nr:hypothetical protein [Serratia marcescens]MBH2636647.1 hypothetical protein [Serratia marcescens]NSM55041.1 hypothetical protein [Serratia marcescens]HAT3693757.1 hypothetical protein [Serratia marcescens]
MIEPEKLPIITELNNLLIIYDSIVFFLGLFLAFAYLYRIAARFHLNFYSVTLFSLYVLCSYSSYNIMVMPIHDYNIAIARNIIYHYKIFGFISVIDIVFIIIFFALLAHFTFHSGWFKFRQREYKVAIFLTVAIIIQGCVIGIISTSAFFNHVMQGGLGQIKRQIVYFRGVIYFSVLIYLFFNCTKQLSSLGLYKVLTFFCVFDLINFTSSIAASNIYYDFLWERYGVKITIIDQDKIYNYFTIYSLMIFALFFSRLPQRFTICLATIVIGAVMYFNMYKFLFAFAFLFILYDIIISTLNNKIPKLKITITFLICIIALPAMMNLYSSKSMNTRSSQMTDYWKYTGQYFPASLIGIGYGGLYYSPSGIGDKGETKKIDLMELDAHYKRSIQTPFLTQLKNSGLLGVIFMLTVAVIVTMRMIKANLKLAEHIFSNAICFNIIWLVGSTSILLQPYPMPSLAFVKLLLLLFLILSADKLRMGLHRNAN